MSSYFDGLIENVNKYPTPDIPFGHSWTQGTKTELNMWDHVTTIQHTFKKHLGLYKVVNYCFK